MAIVSNRIDGQTLGFSLTAPDLTVDVLSLDIVSGAVTSSYLTEDDIRNLKVAVEALFDLVPSGQRAAGALGLLQRLITIAPAAAATLSQAAVNTAGDVYALRATVSSAPTQFIAHLPFSADGQLAWATGVDVTGPALPLSLANGGTGLNLSGAGINGLFGVSGGTSGTPLTPLVSAQTTVGAEAADTIPVDFQLRNGSTNYTAQLVFWGQIIRGTLADITVSAGAAGFVLPLGDFATSGRFVMVSDAFGVVNLEVEDTGAEEVEVAYGPGPGTAQLFLGGTVTMEFV